jgi:hypothetical protein
MNSKTRIHNHKVVDFLIQMAENPAKVEEYKINPSDVLSTFDFSDNIKSDIVNGKCRHPASVRLGPRLLIILNFLLLS